MDSFFFLVSFVFKKSSKNVLSLLSGLIGPSVFAKVISRQPKVTPNKERVQEVLERGFICIKVWGFTLLIISHIS